MEWIIGYQENTAQRKAIIVMDMFRLDGKVAVVTGGSSGLGVQFAKALAHQGANIAVVARRKERLETVSKEIDNMGRQCLPVKCDVTVDDEISAAVNAVMDKYGKIDILVNSAGVSMSSPAEKTTNLEWRKVIDADLNGVYLFTKEVAKKMIPRKYGKIINLGSIHSNVAISEFNLSAYCASKGGVLMMTKSLAAEWARYNITVNAIGPAYFESEMTRDVIGTSEFEGFVKQRCPMGRTGKPGELDGALIYLASDASSYTTSTIIYVDGGWNAI